MLRQFLSELRLGGRRQSQVRQTWSDGLNPNNPAWFPARRRLTPPTLSNSVALRAAPLVPWTSGCSSDADVGQPFRPTVQRSTRASRVDGAADRVKSHEIA